MSSPARRIADLEILVSRTREPQGVPTWCFFAQDRFIARANYGGSAPDAVLQAIEAVERTIRAYDEYRVDHHLDVVDLAIFVSRECYPDHAQTASGIAGALVEAFWFWDRERYGEARAWRLQRSRSDFEHAIAGRLAVV